MTKKNARCGVWLIGAHGGLATTMVVGTIMAARKLVSGAGMLTETPPFNQLDLASLDGLVFGGHDVRRSTVYQSAYEIYRENGTFDLEKLQSIKDDLDSVDENVCVGTAFNCGATIRRLSTRQATRRPGKLRALVAAIQSDIESFRQRNDLDRVVVVNVASTEPPLPPDPSLETMKGLRRLLDTDDGRTLRASVIYGYAAAELGLPLINFTPNTGCTVPAIQALARKNKVPIMGNDGKTGETLVKSALAPMFKYRNLKVLTWQGYNILGDRDGQVLSNPENKSSKIKTKDGLLSNILGYPLHTHVGIDYVPSLKDLKTAWDFIHFEGFLDYKMSLQFTWQGCDAILAAPVVLDMVRLADFAHRKQESGLMTWLSCFFKSPIGVDEHDLHFQFHHLLDYVKAHLAGQPWESGLIARTGQVHLPLRPRKAR
ncbi:MAG: myo-inositol-1-phosphate synthase [Planctomycetes bacterium]|nr:myo-inositol-1-phosphate synthase [Planctomycetota bacterium]